MGTQAAWSAIRWVDKRVARRMAKQRLAEVAQLVADFATKRLVLPTKSRDFVVEIAGNRV